MTPTQTQLDAAEAPQLKRYRTLVKHRRYVAAYLRAHPRQAVTLRQCDEERATVVTAIRAIRALRPNCIKCDERPQTLGSGQYCFACVARDRAEYDAWDASLRAHKEAT